MEKEIILLGQAARELGIELNTFQMEQFDLYQKELLLWNAKTNLISEKTAQEIVSRHFLDSLTALHFINNQRARIIDIGSGAGFPGLPLKIARPNLQLYLMESNRKKVSFLKHILRLLNLTETFVLHERAENLIKNNKWKDFFDVVISRATFKLPEFLSLGAFFLAPQGTLIALKGQDIDSEFSACVKSATASYFSELFQHDVFSPFRGIQHKIIVGKKEKKDKKAF
ncbi:MAG: 16S rRNA (guanine(527)-N(7))-methyltransferase RsmG [Smithellaceae bacterium]|jgi:16S rRNA (guanine527-N7)-methyltransferase